MFPIKQNNLEIGKFIGEWFCDGPILGQSWNGLLTWRCGTPQGEGRTVEWKESNIWRWSGVHFGRFPVMIGRWKRLWKKELNGRDCPYQVISSKFLTTTILLFICRFLEFCLLPLEDSIFRKNKLINRLKSIFI